MLPTYDASKVTASGPGLSSYGIPASLPAEFAVDAKDAGEGLLSVQITVSNGPRARWSVVAVLDGCGVADTACLGSEGPWPEISGVKMVVH